MPADRLTEFHLPHPLFDSHFHALHMEEKGIPVRELLTGITQSALIGGIEVSVNEFDFQKRVSLSEQFPTIYLSAGIHPSYSGCETNLWENRFAQIIRQAAHVSVVAIGETGLDFYRDLVPPAHQEMAFREHLSLAVNTGLPVIIHNRNADQRILEIIRESGCRNGVFHCFSSDWDIARSALDLGYHISFAGNITYKNTSVLQDAARRVPADRILIETDAPFLSPQPVRGCLNHPGFLGYTLETLAGIRGVNPEQLARESAENSKKLFARNLEPHTIKGAEGY